MEIDIVGNKKSWIKLTYNGVYNFDILYRDIINTFKKNGYFFNEKGHTEMVKPAGKDHIILFEASREVDNYARYLIKIEIWGMGMKDVSIKEEWGRKIKTVKGEIQIRIKGSMDIDFKGRFDKYGKLGKVMRNFYNKYIISKRIWGKYTVEVYTETNELISNLKKDLGMAGY